jgi:hypothetical protein
MSKKEQNFIEDKLMIKSVWTFETFLKEDNPTDLIALYDFYYYTAKWQKTNRPKASDSYCMKALKWGNRRLTKTKKRLIELKLIEQVNTKDKKGKVNGWYIKLNYIWGNKSNQKCSIHKCQDPLVDDNTTNALSVSSINALSVSNKCLKGEEENEEFRLPLPGKNRLSRIVAYYSSEWAKKYGTKPKITNWGKLGTLFKPYFKEYNEYQLALLVNIYLDWRGATGNSDFEAQRLENACHPLDWMPYKINAMVPYVKNGLGIDLDNMGEVADIINNKLD